MTCIQAALEAHTGASIDAAPSPNIAQAAPAMQAQLPALRRVRENLSPAERDVYPLRISSRRRCLRGASRVFTVISAQNDVDVYEVPHAFGSTFDMLRLVALVERVTPPTSLNLDAGT